MEKLSFQYTPVNKEQIIDDLLESPILRDFFLKHDLTTDFIEENLLDFMTYKTEKNHCLNCKGLNECKQDNIGFEPLISYNGQVRKIYKKCSFLKQRVTEADADTMIDAMHLPSSILEASLAEWDFKRSKNRREVYEAINEFLHDYELGKKPKGLYLWGKNNIGKTYALSALASELRKRHISATIAYYPDLVREFKSRVSKNNLEELISKLKQVEVLMLDDIGGEGDSSWVRDEILGPILQYRLLDKKPTCFSSNYSRVQLAQDHFAKFRDSDKVRATRIVTRIKELTKTEFKDNQIEM